MSRASSSDEVIVSKLWRLINSSAADSSINKSKNYDTYISQCLRKSLRYSVIILPRSEGGRWDVCLCVRTMILVDRRCKPTSGLSWPGFTWDPSVEADRVWWRPGVIVIDPSASLMLILLPERTLLAGGTMPEARILERPSVDMDCRTFVSEGAGERDDPAFGTSGFFRASFDDLPCDMLTRAGHSPMCIWISSKENSSLQWIHDMVTISDRQMLSWSGDK